MMLIELSCREKKHKGKIYIIQMIVPSYLLCLFQFCLVVLPRILLSYTVPLKKIYDQIIQLQKSNIIPCPVWLSQLGLHLQLFSQTNLYINGPVFEGTLCRRQARELHPQWVHPQEKHWHIHVFGLIKVTVPRISVDLRIFETAFSPVVVQVVHLEAVIVEVVAATHFALTLRMRP